MIVTPIQSSPLEFTQSRVPSPLPVDLNVKSGDPGNPQLVGSPPEPTIMRASPVEAPSACAPMVVSNTKAERAKMWYSFMRHPPCSTSSEHFCTHNCQYLFAK